MKEVLEVVVLDVAAPAALISSFLFVWFKTDFLTSYLGLLNIRFKEYENSILENPDLTLFEYFACKYSQHKFKFFIFKLLSCPFCLAAWLSLCVSLLYSIKLIGLYYVLSLVLFKFLEKIFFSDD